MTPIEAALAALDSLEPGEKICYADIAREYGCDRNTLSRRHRRVQSSREQKVEKERLLTVIQEKELIEYIDRLTVRGIPPTNAMVWNFAAEIAGKEPGNLWVQRFQKRHKNSFVLQWATGIDTARH
jgi:transposase-like protein